MNRCFLYKLYLTLLLLFIIGSIYSQSVNTVKVQNGFSNDSSEAIRLIKQIDTLYKHEDFQTTSKLIEQAVTLCEKLGFTGKLADLYKIKGDIYRSTDDYVKALEALSTSLDFYKKSKNSKGIASIKNRMGAVYRLQGKYPAALEFYFESLKMYQSIHDKSGTSGALNNIGIVYQYQNEYDKALEYYLSSLKLGEELNDEESICISYLNIGQAYQKKEEYRKAIDYFLKSLIIAKKLKNLDGIGVNYNEIGAIYTEQNDLQQAQIFLNKALKVFVELGSKSRQAECHLYMGNKYFKSKEYLQAISHYQKALSLSKGTGAKELYSNALFKLSEVYECISNTALALKYYKIYIDTRDSIFNEENTKRSVQAELLYQFERKQDLLKVIQEKRDEMFFEKVKNQKMVRNYLIAILAMLIILIAFVLSAYIGKQKANIILTNQQNEILEKNEELMQQQEEILAQRDEIEHKNLILEHSKQIIAAKNERIISSIEYAQTIQQAILPHEEQLNDLFNDQFVIFLPKDIVSGDFYWISAEQNIVFVAVIDCTGHGVPGSFMSLIGNTILNQIVNEWHTHDPAQILELLNQKIRKALQQDETHGKSHASMDVCLIKINRATQKATFAGANRPLLIIQDGKLGKIIGDKKSVGGYQRESNRYYTNQEINLNNNSYLYLTTDGFIDQMNSEKRKFGQKQFSELLLEHHTKPMNIQKEVLLNMLNTYKQDEEQIDDICILGIKV